MTRGLKRLAAVFGSVVALSAAMPAFAADELTGDWLFDTSKFAGDCQISGRIRFTETSVKNTYSCKFESEQICGPLSNNLYIKVQQSCTAQKVGKQIAIKTQVDKILDRKPKLDPLIAFESYLADNFIVQMQKNLSEMIGQHYDAQRQLKARFWRDIELIS
jgi:hypothetical protein